MNEFYSRHSKERVNEPEDRKEDIMQNAAQGDSIYILSGYCLISLDREIKKKKLIDVIS